MTLDWYFDFISPYAYLQSVKFPQLPAGTQLRVKPVLFGALLDKSGTLGPAEIPGKREFTFRQALWLAGRHGVKLKMPPRHPFNPLPVLRLAVAIDAPLDKVKRIFEFIWAQGRDPSDPAEFAALAAEMGVDDAEARVADPQAKAKLKSNTDEAIAAGVWGVPTFVADGFCFWGFDSGAMLLDYLANPAMFSGPEYARIDSLPSGIQRKLKS
ncbi:MAG TPA: 2-hydroxychromene-2-carboxylate isomerase [Burkholderiales bacterium]